MVALVWGGNFPTGDHVTAAVILVPLGLAVEPWPSPLVAPLARGVVVYCAVPVTLGHLWYYQAVRTVGAGRAAAFLNVQPFMVLLLSWLILDEPVHAYHVAGATLVIVGVWLTTRP